MRLTILPALLGALLSTCASVVAAAPTAATASTLACKPYIPFGPNYGEPTGNVEFTGSGIDVFGYPNNPMTTRGDYYSAWTFYVRTCNSSSLQLHSYNVPKGCTQDSDTNCHSFNYIQIINTKTGHCMTWDNYGAPSDITFTPCDQAPTTTSQLFKAKSMSFYQDFSNPGPLSPIFFNNGQYTGNWTFVVAPDGKTPLIGADASQGTVAQGYYIATTRK